MRGAERSAGNTAKNIALIVLAVLMAVLCAANWLAGVSAASLGSDNPLRRVHDRLFGGAAGYEIRSSGVSAAYPAVRPDQPVDPPDPAGGVCPAPLASVSDRRRRSLCVQTWGMPSHSVPIRRCCHPNWAGRSGRAHSDSGGCLADASPRQRDITPAPAM